MGCKCLSVVSVPSEEAAGLCFQLCHPSRAESAGKQTFALEMHIIVTAAREKAQYQSVSSSATGVLESILCNLLNS